MTLEQLREKHQKAIIAARAAELAAAEYNHALATFLLEQEAPPGFAVDLFGDGKIKPAQACAPPAAKG